MTVRMLMSSRLRALACSSWTFRAANFPLQGAVETLKRCRPVVLIEEKPIGGPGGDMSHVTAHTEFLIGLGMEQCDRIGADRAFVFPG